MAGRVQTGSSAAEGVLATTIYFPVAPSMAFDAGGNLYLSVMSAGRLGGFTNVIRRVDGITGRVQTVAGTGTAGNAGDYVPAGMAQLNNPHGLAFDSQHHLYVTDSRNSRIQKLAI